MGFEWREGLEHGDVPIMVEFHLPRIIEAAREGEGGPTALQKQLHDKTLARLEAMDSGAMPLDKILIASTSSRLYAGGIVTGRVEHFAGTAGPTEDDLWIMTSQGEYRWSDLEPWPTISPSTA